MYGLISEKVMKSLGGFICKTVCKKDAIGAMLKEKFVLDK